MIAVIGHLGSTVDVRYDHERKLYICSNCALLTRQDEAPRAFEVEKPWTMLAHMVEHERENNDVVPLDSKENLAGDCASWIDPKTEKTDA